MNKKQLTLGLILFAAFIFVFVYKPGIFSRSKKDEVTNNQSDTNTEESVTNEKTPEQVLRELDALENPEPEGPLSAEIVSPEEETFMMSQARLYRAEITNGLSGMSKKTVCNWRYYIEGDDDEEVLYKEQTVPMTADRCGFTSTFIDKRGKLRVEVEVEIVDKKTGEILDTFTTDKEYIVK